MGKRFRKATNDALDAAMLVNRAHKLKMAGYDKPKWIVFCELLLMKGYSLTLYEARQTFSKYITVSRGSTKPFKVRFSNHKPIREREINGDCDYFVGVTNLRTTNTAMALAAVDSHFNHPTKEQTHG